MPYELRVTVSDGAGGTEEHVYTDAPAEGGGAGILEDQFRVTREATDQEIRVGDLELSVAAPFLGASSRSELPPPLIPGVRRGRGMYRAVLTHTAAAGGDPVVILDGAIAIVDVKHESLANNFRFPLVAAAVNDFWTRLGEWSFGDLTSGEYAALETVEMPYAYERTTQWGPYSTTRWFYSDVDGSPVSRTMPVFPLPALLADVLPLAAEPAGLGDIELVGELPALSYSVSYVDSNTDPQTITRESTPHVFGMGLRKGSSTIGHENPTLPAWTARMLWEAALAAFGWRARAEYAAYPSTAINIRVFADTLPTSTDGAPDLAPRLAKSGYTRGAEPGSTGGFGIVHAGEFAPVPPLPTYARLVGLGLTGVPAGHGLIGTPPPAPANIALDQWTFVKERRGVARRSDPEPTADDVRETRFTLPMIAPPEEEGFELETDDVEPDLTNHPDYIERVIYGAPLLPAEDADAGFLCAVHAKDSVHWLLHARRVLAVPGDGQHTLVNEVWARELYALRGASVAPLEAAEGEFNVQGLVYEPGNPNACVALEGVAWEVRREEREASADVATLALVRPVEGAELRPALPPAPGAVSDLRARFHRVVNFPPSEHHYTVVSWSPPSVIAPASYYAATLAQVDGPTKNIISYGPALLFDQATVPPDEEFSLDVTAVGENALAGPTVSIAFTTTEDDIVNP